LTFGHKCDPRIDSPREKRSLTGNESGCDGLRCGGDQNHEKVFEISLSVVVQDSATTESDNPRRNERVDDRFSFPSTELRLTCRSEDFRNGSVLSNDALVRVHKFNTKTSSDAPS
jgi:hypothetical protein